MKPYLLAFLLCLVALPAAAQVPPIVNPTGVEWDSADHDAVANGAPVITRYLLEIATSATTPVIVRTVDMGKPTLVGGKVTYLGLGAVVQSLPSGNYIAVVKAEGPGGVSAGTLSDPFTVKVRVPAAPGKPAWKQ